MERGVMMVKLFGTLETGGAGQQVAVVDESGRNMSKSVNNSRFPTAQSMC